MTTLPGPLCLSSAFPFVGRARELTMLRSLVPWAAGEGRRVAIVGGEAGSGKSRLVREFAVAAAADGALVLYGACDAVVRPPYGPFVEALEHLARVTEVPAGPELARLLGGPAPPPAADPDTERHRLHTAVTNLLEDIGRRQPVLLVIEDAHWADAPTLALIRHLARAAGRVRLLLLATFRDTEAEMPESLAETLADLRRAEDVVRLRLGGLSGDEVTEFVRRSGGALELADTISEVTDGNPFLVCELWRALVESGRALDDLSSPESVREVVGRRVAALRPATADLLELAATAGAEFDLEVLGPAANRLSALEEAIASGMVEGLPSRRAGYRFTHELVRRSLYDALPPVRRAELHLRVGEAYERAGARHVAELAHHFAAAAPFGGTARGVEYNVLAAREASAGLDYEGAAERLRVALELGVESPAERTALLLELGDARHRAGRAMDALAAFAEAAEIATGLGDAELLARAAIGYETACWRPVITDALAVELLERAAAALDDQPSQLRIGVLGGLARALEIRGGHARGALARNRAIDMARQIDDRAALARVLSGSFWARGTRSTERILAMLTEARDLAEELGDDELQCDATSWRVSALVALCDIEAARRETAAAHATAERTAQPFHLHVAEHSGSAIALCQGRLGDAEAMAERSHEWSRLLTGRDASGVYGIQMFGLRRELGRLAELAPVIRVLAVNADAWRPGLALLLAELGMETEARRELARVAADGLDPFRASLWLASLSYLTEACAALGDEATAALLYPELAPYEGSNVMIGHVVACHGAADRLLGMLASTLGEWDRAERHFERAMALNRAMGARTWLAHSAYEYGRMRLRRGLDGEQRMGEAERLATDIGLHALLGRIRALGAPRAVAGPPDGLSFREVQVLGLVANGLSNREIGGALFISEHTAANHIRSILRKTSWANRTEATSYAYRHGLVEA